MLFTLRTGSEDFSHWLVTSRLLGGAMPGGMRCNEGRLWKEGELIETPEEADVFKAIGLEWIEPEERGKGFWWETDAF